jgi:alpha-1,3-mannosyl-glycoprotein beta-1,2-N-acetylglucosaminyltransferase
MATQMGGWIPSHAHTQDDMELAPDFFSYFEAGAALLDKDTSLWCISSWNDHGTRNFVADPKRLYRSDFFPGLGWMLRRDTWDTLRDSWCEMDGWIWPWYLHH